MTTKGLWIAMTAVWLAGAVCPAQARRFLQEQKTPQQQEEKKAQRTEKKKPQEKPYGLIFGTAYGPDDRPLYGVTITIRREGKKHSTWELVSDHRGEFAQRVPADAADYLIKGEAEYAPMGPDGKPQMSKKKKLRGETRVHIEGEERQDVGVHLQ
ncbi:MAG TPA: hypothetical protein VFR84_00785 [Candidatus Angelobacter sp.]|nr:hypothetical protein [Candidatus Angelobacter sp.]